MQLGGHAVACSPVPETATSIISAVSLVCLRQRAHDQDAHEAALRRA